MPGVQAEEPEQSAPSAPAPSLVDSLYHVGSRFVRAALPARDPLAVNSRGEPMLFARSIVEIGAQPGVGKSLTTMALSVAASLGDTIFGIRWTRPLRVLTIDMELSQEECQERYMQELAGREASDNWRLVCSNDLEVPLGALYEPSEQARLASLYEWAEVVIIDTASHALPTEDDNSAAAWKPAEDFLLMLRRMGKLVIVTFHLNAQGNRIRGTSAKQQCADLIAMMVRPADSDTDGCHFNLTWTKHRGVTKDVTSAFEARMLSGGGWDVSMTTDAKRREVLIGMLLAGQPVASAALEVGIPESTAYRWRKESGLFGKRKRGF